MRRCVCCRRSARTHTSRGLGAWVCKDPVACRKRAETREIQARIETNKRLRAESERLAQEIQEVHDARE